MNRFLTAHNFEGSPLPKNTRDPTDVLIEVNLRTFIQLILVFLNLLVLNILYINTNIAIADKAEFLK